MIRATARVVATLAVAALPSAALAQTTVRSAPGGKILAVVDGNDIRPQAGGGRLLFVDGAEIRRAPGQGRVLFVDGPDVRPAPGGHRLAFWDGGTLRRGPGGRILLVVDGPDVRETPGGKRLLYLDGAAPGRSHMTAVLYHLQPSLFTLTRQEEEAAKAALREGQAWNAEQEKPEKENGTYKQVTASGVAKQAGSLTVKWHKDHYALAFEKEGVRGVAVKRSDSGWRMTGGLATGKATYGLFAYRNGAYQGIWLDDPAGAAKAVDQWTGPPTELGTFASKIGSLRFTASGNLAGNGALFDVASDKGKGVAFVGGNKAAGYVLAVVIGERAMVMDSKIDGETLEADYQGTDGEGRYFNVSK